MGGGGEEVLGESEGRRARGPRGNEDCPGKAISYHWENTGRKEAGKGGVASP